MLPTDKCGIQDDNWCSLGNVQHNMRSAWGDHLLGQISKPPPKKKNKKKTSNLSQSELPYAPWNVSIYKKNKRLSEKQLSRIQKNIILKSDETEKRRHLTLLRWYIVTLKVLIKSKTAMIGASAEHNKRKY